MKLATYIRTSTAEQNPELQTRELAAFVGVHKDWREVRRFQEVISGAKASRPELKKLLDGARRREFDAVLVWKLDRFGRSVLDLETNISALARVGVRLISATEAIDTAEESPAGTMFRQLLATFAQFERSLIRERSDAGMKRYQQDLKAGRVGKTVNSHSGKNLPPGRPRRVFDRDKIGALYAELQSIRAVAKKLGISKGLVERTLKTPPGKEAA